MPVAFYSHATGFGQSSFIGLCWSVALRMLITSQYFLGKRMARCVGRRKTVPQDGRKPQEQFSKLSKTIAISGLRS